MPWKVNKPVSQSIVCSLTKTPTVYLEPMPRQKIEMLMDFYPNQEWFAYLVGKVSEENNVFVEDIVVPPHADATGGSAEASAPAYDSETGRYLFHNPLNTVGVIHSHNSMGAFHSGTDHEHVDQNYLISITAAKRGANIEFDTVCYVVTPCGKASTGRSQIRYVQPKPLFDSDEWLKQAKHNIDMGRRVFSQAPFLCNQELQQREFEQILSKIMGEDRGTKRSTEELLQKTGRGDGYLPLKYRYHDLLKQGKEEEQGEGEIYGGSEKNETPKGDRHDVHESGTGHDGNPENKEETHPA